MNIIYEIMTWLYETLVAPMSDFFADRFDLLNFNATPISITMPGSNTVMFTASVSDLFMFVIAILVFIGSLWLLKSAIKWLYKFFRGAFGGRR